MKIIFEDEFLMVLDKPPGLVVDRSETNKTPTLEDWLDSLPTFSMGPRGNDRIERAGIVHRLDKDTSGILLVAKHKQVLKNLQEQFYSRKIKKEYLALAHGRVESAGSVVGGIERNPVKREKFMVSEDGKEAVTEYSPEGNFQIPLLIFNDLNKIQMKKLKRMHYNQFTLLSCHPLTGRTHQIRVHLKYIGHPIVSDEKYVGRKMYRLDKRWCPRMFLHAKKIGFYHPRNGKWTEVESELPEDLRAVLSLLER